MIILDTNVISEPLRQGPSAAVRSWLDEQLVDDLYLTTITLAEMRFGIAALPTGNRKKTLARRFEDEVLPLFDGRILTFDVAAANVSGELRAKARAGGDAVGDFDALIASIAVCHDFAVATRDEAPFRRVGVDVINPFERS